MSTAPREGVILGWAFALHVPTFFLLYALINPKVPSSIALAIAIYMWSLAAAHVIEVVTRPAAL